ncbi:MAG: hypothetical protein KF708_13540 [Pirellulales bacterium]|nr:hypothetical protein [Pirellulales bacterium]
MESQSVHPEETPRARPRMGVGQWLVGLLLGAVGGLLLAVVVGVWLFRDPMPRLTPERLSAAVERWRAAGPRSYDLNLKLTGGQTGLIHIEVRNGEVTAMTRNGRTPDQRRTWEYWTVENQFDALDMELHSARDPQRAFGVSDPNSIVLRAEFDPQYGYPRVYHRIVLGHASELRWEATSFVPRNSQSR